MRSGNPPPEELGGGRLVEGVEGDEVPRSERSMRLPVGTGPGCFGPGGGGRRGIG
jgi:hypothetical protein